MSQGVAILLARYCLLDQLMQSLMPCNKGLGLSALDPACLDSERHFPMKFAKKAILLSRLGGP